MIGDEWRERNENLAVVEFQQSSEEHAKHT